MSVSEKKNELIKMTKRLDISEFPRINGKDLNYVEYFKYLAIIDTIDEETESKFNKHLRKVFNDGGNLNVQTC